MPPNNFHAQWCAVRTAAVVIMAFIVASAAIALPADAQSAPTRRVPRRGGSPATSFDRPARGTSIDARGRRVPLYRRTIRTVADSTDYPWACVCQIVAMFPVGTVLQGSGTMIGPHHCLTALHLLFNTRTRETANRVRIIPGYDEDRSLTEGLVARPFGTTSINQFLFWEPHDIAIVVTSTNIGDESSWMNPGSLTDRELTSQTFQLAGYPESLNGSERQGKLSTSVSHVEGDRVTLLAECPEGLVGGPIFEQTAKARDGDQDTWSIMGVITGSNRGSRIPEEMRRILGRFFHDDFSGVSARIPIPTR